jgi:hypothetical protein
MSKSNLATLRLSFLKIEGIYSAKVSINKWGYIEYEIHLDNTMNYDIICEAKTEYKALKKVLAELKKRNIE